MFLGISLLALPLSAEEPRSPHVGFSTDGGGPTKYDELSTVVAMLELHDATIDDAMKRLSAESKLVDPDQTGVTFTVDPSASISARPVTLNLHNISIYDAFRNICKLANVKAKLVGAEIHVVSMQESVDFINQPSIDQSGSRHVVLVKVQSIVIDKVSLKKLDVVTTLKILEQKTKQADPEKKGLNFVLGTIAPADQVQRQVTLSTSSIPLCDLLAQISQQTGLRYFIEDGAVYFKP